jgi:PIN like domain
VNERRRVALDQNFPEPILRCLQDYIADVEFVSLRHIDARLPDLDDRPLIIALHNLGWDCLVTNNYRMLKTPSELAAIMHTRMTVFAIDGVGDDPISATGAVLLDLPRSLRRVDANRAQVFWMRPRTPAPMDPWDLFGTAADHQHRQRQELYDELRVSDAELRGWPPTDDGG